MVCQLDSLRKCLKLDALRKALNTLPKTLDDTYERILSNLDEEYEGDALTILQWLCFSKRPMRLNEMVEVLAIDLTNEFCFLPVQRLPDPRDILTICSTLVSVVSVLAIAKRNSSWQTYQSEELRLAHFSVKEYLISDRLKRASMHRYHITPLSANVSIAKCCLIYLLYFKSPAILTAECYVEFPLIEYAAEFWPWHYRSIVDSADKEAVDFLGYDLVESKNSCFLNWLRIFNPDRLWQKIKENPRREIPDSLYFMAQLGISGVLKMLLNKGANVNAGGGDYGSAISAASHNGHEGIVRLLLEKGANVDAEGGRYGNALSAASRRGHEGVVRLLLEKRASVNARCGEFGNALSAASYGGEEEVVRFLLEKGANVNAEGGEIGNALSAASLEGHEGIVRLLLEKGANVDAEGGWYGNALSAASFRGHEGVVRLLLEKGANVNAGGEEFANAPAEGEEVGNALSAASFGGHESVVRLLLEKGANVNAEGGRYGNALAAASFRGNDEVLRLLLKYKADAMLVLHDDNKSLQGVSVDDHEAVIQLLLEKLQ